MQEVGGEFCAEGARSKDSGEQVVEGLRKSWGGWSGDGGPTRPAFTFSLMRAPDRGGDFDLKKPYCGPGQRWWWLNQGGGGNRTGWVSRP